MGVGGAGETGGVEENEEGRAWRAEPTRGILEKCSGPVSQSKGQGESEQLLRCSWGRQVRQWDGDLLCLFGAPGPARGCSRYRLVFKSPSGYKLTSWGNAIARYIFKGQEDK